MVEKEVEESPLEIELKKYEKPDESVLKKIAEEFDANFEIKLCFGNVYACIEYHHNKHILRFLFTRQDEYFKFDQKDVHEISEREKLNTEFYHN